MNISDRLNELMLSYRREAHRCLRAKAFLAATIIQASAFEAGLQAMCFLYPEDVKRTTVYARKHFRGKRYRALEFSFPPNVVPCGQYARLPNRLTKQVIFAGRAEAESRCTS